MVKATKAIETAVIRAAKRHFLETWGWSIRCSCEVQSIEEIETGQFKVEIWKWDGHYPEGNWVNDFVVVRVEDGRVVATDRWIG